MERSWAALLLRVLKLYIQPLNSFGIPLIKLPYRYITLLFIPYTQYDLNFSAKITSKCLSKNDTPPSISNLLGFLGIKQIFRNDFFKKFIARALTNFIYSELTDWIF